MNIQERLDEWLASNPEAQKYVLKLWYLQDGQPWPPGVTHTLALASARSPERTLTIGLVLKPEAMVLVEALLAMVATAPPA